jgi:hypothetical protein
MNSWKGEGAGIETQEGNIITVTIIHIYKYINIMTLGLSY